MAKHSASTPSVSQEELAEFLGSLLPPEKKLADAIRQNNYPRTYALLRKLEGPLRGSAAADCLTLCFHRTEKLFRAVLDKCAPGTFFGSVDLLGDSGRVLHLEGTVLLLAAAAGMEAHVELLLERGYDVNAASLDSACSRSSFDGGDVYNPNYRFCARPTNLLTMSEPDGRRIRIQGCTPLAAAIAAGNAFTADLLLRTPGVWKTESSAVCRAAALHTQGGSLRENWVIPWCFTCVVRSPEELDRSSLGKYDPIPLGDLGETLFPRVNMQPASFADLCAPELLEKQFRSGQCSEDDARGVLEVLGRMLEELRYTPPASSRKQRLLSCGKKLLLTAEYFPQVCREPMQARFFLSAYLACTEWGCPGGELLDCWKALSGTRRDVSHGLGGLDLLPGGARRACLQALAEGGELYAAADAVHPVSRAALTDLARYVRIVPSPFRNGLSAFALSALRLAPELRSFRKLLRCGLTCESREALVRAAEGRLRPLLLTADWAEPEETYPLERYTRYFRHELAEEGGPVPDGELERVFFSPLEEEECLRYFCDPRFYDMMFRLQASDFQKQPDLPELDCAGLLPSLWTAANGNALRAWTKLDPRAPFLELTVSVRREGALEAICGPALGLAAAAGRTENVRFLLSLSGDPDLCCFARLRGREEPLPCTPFLLALYFAREETARFLLEAGTVCLPDREPYRTFLRALPPEGRALAARLPGLGLEPAEAKEAD